MRRVILLKMNLSAGIGPVDGILIQIVDSAMAEAAGKSGSWLVCRPGCTQCCIGPFPITQLDARRLRLGLGELAVREPETAVRVRERARQAVARLSTDFPGDPITGLLAADDTADERFADFANDEPCPALDPDTGTCDLYAARPITCRTCGPPIRCESGELACCELCFQGATDAEIASCEVEIDPQDLEPAILEELENTTGVRGQTIVAYCLAS